MPYQRATSINGSSNGFKLEWLLLLLLLLLLSLYISNLISFIYQTKENRSITNALPYKSKSLNAKGNSIQQFIVTNDKFEMYCKMCKLLLQGKPITTSGSSSLDYDSDDDPQSIVGKRIHIHWADKRVYSGRVSYYDPFVCKHHIIYDDGEEKDYSLFEKLFTLTNE